MFGLQTNPYGNSSSRWSNLRNIISTFTQNLEHPRLVLAAVAAVILLLFGTIIGVSTKSHHSKAQLVAAGIAGKDPTNSGAVNYDSTVSGNGSVSASSDNGSNDSASSSSGDDNLGFSGDDGQYDYSLDNSDGSDSYDTADSGDSDTNNGDSVDETYDEINNISYATPSSAPITITPAQQGSGSKSAKVQKLLIFVEENHSFSQMLAGMPYTAALAHKYGYATNYYAIRHPSLPNYISIAGGNTYGISNDQGPGQNPVNGSSIFGKAIGAGKSARLYADGMSNNCMLSPGGNQYQVKHNPWAYFVKERSLCQKYDVPVSDFNSAVRGGSLPNLGMVIPNMCHDAHNCSLGMADDWFKSQMSSIFAGPDWKAGRLAIVLTADEDDSKGSNKVLTVVIHPSQKGHVVAARLTHYSLSRLAAQVTHSSPVRDANSAPNMATAFNLPL